MTNSSPTSQLYSNVFPSSSSTKVIVYNSSSSTFFFSLGSSDLVKVYFNSDHVGVLGKPCISN